MLEISSHRGIVTVALDRPQYHNALTKPLIAKLTATFLELSDQTETRCIVLTGNGRSFCAGADLSMMKSEGKQSFDENVRSGQAIFDLMQAVDSCSKPVIARVNGAAIGGGAGLVSCCDIVVASQRAIFGFTEVRLGLVPATISPFVLTRVSYGHARELFLTGERFDSGRALQIGLVDWVVPEEQLDDKVNERLEQLLLAGPGAQATTKQMLRIIDATSASEARELLSNLIAERRASPEGLEGMTAFLEKRRPKWQLNSG